MSFEDFLTSWHTVQICHLSADSFSGEIEKANDVIYLRKIFLFIF